MMSINISKLCLKQPIQQYLRCAVYDFTVTVQNTKGRSVYLEQKKCFQTLSSNGNVIKRHYTFSRLPSFSKSWCNTSNLLHKNYHSLKAIESNPSSTSMQLVRTNAIQLYSTAPETLSNKEKLKRAVKEYGSTVIIFHITISLISLGGCYLAVTSGINVANVLHDVGFYGSSDVANEAGMFVVAYAVHKVLAPVRICITLAATPLIVRYLRKISVLKPPKPKT